MRYTCSGQTQDEVVKFIMKNALKFIIAKEIASREHIQCYVETKVVKKTWVNQFNLQIKLDRRDKYVELDKGNTKLYICKGNGQTVQPEILAKRGFTDEEIVSFHNEYWLNKKTIEMEFTPVSSILPPVEKLEKVKKAKTPTFMSIIRNELEEEYPYKEWDMKDKPLVFKKLMFKLGVGCRNLDHIIISRMTYGVLNSLIKDKKEWHEYWYRKAFNGEELYEVVDDVEDMKLDEEIETILPKRKIIKKKVFDNVINRNENNIKLCIIEDD
jgi:hypothetical protein